MENQHDHDLLIRMDANLANLKRIVEQSMLDHEKRLRSVERRQWINYGAIAASVGTAGALVKHIVTGGK